MCIARMFDPASPEYYAATDVVGLLKRGEVTPLELIDAAAEKLRAGHASPLAAACARSAGVRI